MSRAILGKKIGMTRIYDETGNCVPVTAIEAGPCVVVQKRTPAKHRYSAIQLGFEEVPARKLNKPRAGVFERRDLKPMRHLREVRMPPAEVDAYKVGEQVTVSIFQDTEFVDITGTSKGRGFQGVVRRYGFQGSTKTRGTHENRRHPGSIGNNEFPGRVFKGHRLPGHMGNRRVTTQNIKVVRVDEDRNVLLVRGAVPGHPGGLVLIRKAIKKS
ncbi:MAG: 50S ribosomal protein L3 [Deltaproteobacteria bacterium]|nr:50S ribosomal protein L3 [Deltaproteobacteria bacterium]